MNTAYPLSDEKGNYCWRNVSGKRIKIYQHLGLSGSMKESGKFDSKLFQANKVADGSIKTSQTFNDKINGKIQKEVLEQTQSLTEKYKDILIYDDPMSKKQIIWGTMVMGKDDLANAAYNLNLSFFNDYDSSMETLQKQIDIGFHTPTDDLIGGVVAHEVGHNIGSSLYRRTTNDKIKNSKGEEKYIKSFMKRVDDRYKKEVNINLNKKVELSEYGSQKPGEAFAESFREYSTCSKPRDYARIFGEELEKERNKLK